MNNRTNKMLLLTVLVSTMHFCSANTVTKISPRSQSLNTARQMIGWNNPDWGINRKPNDTFYASTNLTFAYTSTFRGDLLTHCLFGNDLTCGNCGPAILISGSQRNDRTPTDWLADYFGLPRDYKSSVSFKPQITNFILDFSFYAGLDQWLEGLYFRIHGPFVHTRWNIEATEDILARGSVGYFQGYFGPHNVDDISKKSTVDVSLLNKRFLDYSNGCTPSLPDDICWQSLQCSKIADNCSTNQETLNGFADLRFALGWNFLNNVEGDGHLGLGIYVAAPTGTRPGFGCETGSYLFEPIVGNGHHWELGGQITAHHFWWHSDTNEARFGFFLEADIMHMFTAHQMRCFDLSCNGPNSRYMIAQRLASNKEDDPRLDGTSNADIAFANVFAPVANITQREVNVNIAVQADIAVSLQYQKNNFSWDVGYNFWGRSCEKICINECSPIPFGDWALKGDNRVYGFVADATYPSPYAMVLPVPLAATDSTATIHQGSNLRNGVNYKPIEPLDPSNFYGDSATRATATANAGIVTNGIVTRFADQAEFGSPTDQIYSSKNPILITACDFNLQGSRGISNKIFTNLNWAWNDRDESNWVPYLSFGAEVEFGNASKTCALTQPTQIDCTNNAIAACNTPCTTCNNPCGAECNSNGCGSCCGSCALSQWGMWMKFGASYN